MAVDLIRELQELTRTVDASSLKVSVLGVGSEFRADDAFGLVVVKSLMDRCKADNCGVEKRLQLLYGETAPENFTGDIKNFAPTHLVIIDAAEMGKEPGEIRIIKKDEIKGVTFSTHVLPLSMMVDYLSKSFKFETVVIGVEPKETGFDRPMSKEVCATASEVSDQIFGFIKEII